MEKLHQEAMPQPSVSSLSVQFNYCLIRISGCENQEVSYAGYGGIPIGHVDWQGA